MTRSPLNAALRLSSECVTVPALDLAQARRSNDRGAAAVETAIVLPLVLLLVLGIIDFGRILNIQITLSAAAREGARWAALRLDTSTGTSVSARVTAAATGVTPTTSVLSSCPANPSPAQNASVTATYAYSLPGLSAIGALLGGGIPGTITVTGRGVMRCGG